MNLENVKNHINNLNHPSKQLLLEMIKETEADIKKTPKEKRQTLIDLHDKINTLVISEPDNSAFRLAKSRMDDLVETLR